jgi:hypothetical protein
MVTQTQASVTTESSLWAGHGESTLPLYLDEELELELLEPADATAPELPTLPLLLEEPQTTQNGQGLVQRARRAACGTNVHTRRGLCDSGQSGKNALVCRH